MEDFSVLNSHRHLLMSGVMHGPEKDAADFMAELNEENPETYQTWLRITTRDEFNEKFRRSFISALCKFCINRKQMELARYRREFVGAVLAYTKADIGVNLFCDKNGGGFLNNSLKSRRAYQKRRRECGWQEQSTPASFLPQGSTLSSLLQTFRQQQQQTLQSPPTSVADILRRTNSLEPIQMRTPSPPSATDHNSDSPLAETTIKVSDRASSSSSSSTTAASIYSVFVRYRRVNEKDGWKDLDVKQSKLSFGSFATVQNLYSSLLQKWHLNELDSKRLILRIFDKDFEEYVDIEENFSLVSLENLAKYELIHRVNDIEINVVDDDEDEKEAKNNNVLFDNENLNKFGNMEMELPNATDLTNLLKDFQNASQNFQNDNTSSSSSFNNNENAMDLFVRNAALFLRANQQPMDEKSNDLNLAQPLYSLFNPVQLIENLVGHSFVNSTNNTNEENSTKIDIMDILSKSDYGRACLQNFQALENGTEKFLANNVKTKLISVLGQWLLANCQKIGNPSEEERQLFVECVLEQLPVKLDKTVFAETLDSFLQNHQQLPCGISSNRKRQRPICAIGQN